MEARGVRADPDTLGSNRTSSDTGSRPKSQLGPTQPNPGQIRPTQPNPGPQRSPRLGPNRDPSTLTLPNGPNLTQRSGKLCNTRKKSIWGVGEVRSLASPSKRKHFDNCIHERFICTLHLYLIWGTRDFHFSLTNPQAITLPIFWGTYLQLLAKDRGQIRWS